MATLIKTNIAGFYKDPATNAVINKDEAEFRIFQSTRDLHRNNVKALREVSDVRKELEDLKRLLLKLTASI